MNREEWIRKGQEIFAREQRLYKVQESFIKAGWSEEEARELLEEVKKKNEEIRLDKRMRIFFVAGIVLMIFGIFLGWYSYQVLPRKNIYENTVLISMLLHALFMGGFLVGLFLFYSARSYQIEKNDTYKTRGDGVSGYVIFGILLISLFAFVFSGVNLSMRFEEVADEMLFENGIETIGRVIDGHETEMRVRRSTSIEYYLKVRYKVAGIGQTVDVESEVSFSEYRQAFKNQIVKLVYSKSNYRQFKIVEFTYEK